MKIESLTLKGYHRIALSGIRYLHLTPQSNYQLILGTNGSGKSSILHELSPLPSNRNDFEKGGYKEIRLSHRGHTYVCRSTFEGSQKHSFIKDGEELNTGHTQRVQTELCLRELGYSTTLHDLLTGRLTFTQMPIAQRREWITGLSTVDYSYGLSIFQKLKSLTRDHVGVLKHQKSRLAEETQSLKALEIATDAEAIESLLHDEITLLIQNQKANIPEVIECQRRHTEYTRLLETQFRDFHRTYNVVYPVAAFVETADTQIAHYRDQYQQLKGKQALLVSEHESLSSQPGLTLTDTETQSIDNNAVERDINAIETRLAGILQETLESPYSAIESVLDALPEWRELYASLQELYTELPPFTESYSRETESNLQSQRDTLQQSIASLEATQSHLKRHIASMESEESQTCPSCHYVWVPGVSESDLVSYRNRLDQSVSNLQSLQTELNQIQTRLEEISQYRTQVQRLRHYVQNYPRQKGLWDYLKSQGYFLKTPVSVSKAFLDWDRYLVLQNDRRRLESDLERLKAIQERLAFTRANPTAKDRLQFVESELESVSREMASLQKEIAKIEGYQKDYTLLQSQLSDIRKTLTDLLDNRDLTIDAIRNTEIRNLIRKHQSELAHLQTGLQKYRSLKAIVKDLEQSLERVEVDYQAYYNLTQQLSPTTGLIAEQLSGFMSCITSQMNHIVESVWNYDLEILPCGMENGDLNYRFPMRINSQSQLVEDVSYGSKGQMEIINFAFVLTVMLYKDIQDYPLFLDELGSGFDEQHRENVLTFIKQLLDNGQYSQLWMISHHMREWSLFEGGDYLVLDGTNIAVPSRHNTHVSFTESH